MGSLPGYLAPIFIVDKIGRTRLQWIGLLVTALLYAIWGGAYNQISPGGKVALFALSSFFLNFASCSTFMLPVEVFPTRVRTTGHGISAASGKAGAVLTSFAFGIVTEKIGLRGTLGLFSGVLAIASVLTFLIPETSGRSLDDIEADDQIFTSDDDVERQTVSVEGKK